MCSIRVLAEVKRNKITNNTYAVFDITANGKTVRLPVKKYYTKLLAQGTSGNAIAQAITPTSDDYVLIALVIENIPTANKPVDLYITPYIKVDGNAEEKGTTVLFELFENVVELSDNARKAIAPTTLKASSGNGVEYNFLTINGEKTFRGYFGQYTWLPDESGFICGRADGRFYFYNVMTQELVLLGKTMPASGSLGAYVNPSNGLVYYKRRTVDNRDQLLCVNPKPLVCASKMCIVCASKMCISLDF